MVRDADAEKASLVGAGNGAAAADTSSVCVWLGGGFRPLTPSLAIEVQMAQVPNAQARQTTPMTT